MITRTILCAIASFAMGAVRSQSATPTVLASAGASFVNASGSIAFTIGEPVIATQAVGSIIITQGFHQPEEDFSTAVLATIAAPGIAVFPNPTREELCVMLPATSIGWTCTLYDLCGKLALQQALLTDRNTFDLSAFANGPYVLHVADADGQLARTFQLIIAK